jgi:dienelactone hydrolase
MLRRLLIAMMLCSATPALGEIVRIPLPDGTALRAELVLPAEGVPRRPVVIAFHGCGGIGTEARPLRLPARERDWAARLAAAGHPVLFPDSFGSRGLPAACGRPDHPAPSATVRKGDAWAAARWAAAQPWAVPGGAVLLGWSHGGSTVVAASAQPPAGLVRGAVAFYPGCGPLTFPAGRPAPTVPLLMLLGEADDWTNPAPCRRLAAANPVMVQATSFPGARHGFDAADTTVRQMALPNGSTVSTGGDPTAREQSISLVQQFLELHARAPVPR